MPESETVITDIPEVSGASDKTKAQLEEEIAGRDSHPPRPGDGMVKGGEYRKHKACPSCRCYREL